MYVFVNNINQIRASTSPEALLCPVITINTKRVLTKHLYRASGLTDNITSGLHTHLGHNNCYLPSSIFDEETEAQRGETTTFLGCMKTVT